MRGTVDEVWGAGRTATGIWVPVLRLLVTTLAFVIVVAGYMGSREPAARALPPDPVLDTPINRAALRSAAFGSSRLPRTQPTVEAGVPDSRFPYAHRVDRLKVELADGFSSVAYDLWPSTWNGRVIVYHNGHGQDTDASPHVLEWFLSRGWRIVTMAMPLAGQNQSPGFDSAAVLHDELARLSRPLGVFVEPVVAVLNYTGADAMMGLSGGGWTTVLAAAIDPRIERSYPVAGSIPWPWRCVRGRPGCAADLEQRLIPDYLRLYELGSEPPRRQLALYNLDDPCCFGGRSSDVWAPRVRGDFRAVVDLSSNEHAVTATHLRLITEDLGQRADGPRTRRTGGGGEWTVAALRRSNAQVSPSPRIYSFR